MAKLRAGFIVVVNLLLASAFLILSQVNGTDTGERINTAAFTLFPLVGGILLARHPRNPVGYLASLIGLAVVGAGTLFEYASLALREQTAGLPFTSEAAWLSMILWTTVYQCVVLILLLFPNGRLPGRGWKLLVIFTLLITLPVILAMGVIAWRNRHAIVFMETGLIQRSPDMAALFQAVDVWNLLMIGAIVLALVGFIFRFMKARGIERQQLKWFVFGLSSVPASMVLDELLLLFDMPGLQGFNYVLNILSIVAFPVVMLIAITRYRLYDIDLIIRRTLLYTALTLTLAAIYFGVVLGTQRLFTQRFGEQPAILIVLSTLLIAALFQPLRRRFQSGIDRRFYRSRYNTEQTLQSFATRLQNEVDLNEIERYFLAIVNESIQPDHAQLWLKKSDHPGHLR